MTYVEDKGLAFWNTTAAFPSLTPFAQDLLSTPASQAYVETWPVSVIILLQERGTAFARN